MSLTALQRLDDAGRQAGLLGWAQAATATIRVFAVDDQPLCRRGLASMLASSENCIWVGEASDGAEALRMAPALRPDVALIDHRLPDHDGIATIEALQPLWPGARFMLLSSRLELADVRRAMAAGASCVLPKTVSLGDLVQAVRAVHAGQRVVPPAVAAALNAGERDTLLRNELTPREMALLELMARGMDNRAIATAMAITVPTVKFHVTNIMSKLHAANRTAAVLAALRLRLVKLQPAAEETAVSRR
jgi:two-component system, NarL family, response regulator LiaR